jgi:hypothetical protein
MVSMPGGCRTPGSVPHPRRMDRRRFPLAAALGLVLATAGVWAFAGPGREGFAPDPPVHLAEKQWVFELAYDKGAGTIDRARSTTVSKPTGTVRVMGRFALEFWVGSELLDRVRFDVPLLGDDDRERDPKRPHKKPTFAKVTTKVKAQMADHPRATVLAFVDRATGDTRKYFWPPDENGKLTPFSAKAATAALDGGAAPDGAADAATDATPADAAADAPSGDAAPGNIPGDAAVDAAPGNAPRILAGPAPGAGKDTR